MSLLWLTPICDPVSEFLEFPIWDIIFFHHPVKEHLLRKHRKNCESCPTWKVKFKCQVVCPVFLFVLSVLFVILTFELNLPGNFWLAVFAILAMSLIELNILVDRGYKCLHILCLWHPLISFPAKLAKLSPPSSSSSQPKKRWQKRFSTTRRTFDPFMTSSLVIIVVFVSFTCQ